MFRNENTQVKIHKNISPARFLEMILHWIQCMTAIICTTDVVAQSRYIHGRHQLPKIRRPNNWQCASEIYTQRPNNWNQEPEIYTSDQKLAFTRRTDKSNTGHSMTSYSCALPALHLKLLTNKCSTTILLSANIFHPSECNKEIRKIHTNMLCLKTKMQIKNS